jgi:hypothetical protein
MLSSRGRKLLLRVGNGSMGSVSRLKFVGAPMLGRPRDCEVHGRIRVVMLELLDGLGRVKSLLRVRSLANHDLVRAGYVAVTGRGS